MFGVHLFLLGQCATKTVLAQDGKGMDVIQTIQQIHMLPADDLANRVPVDLECIVTCYEPDWAILFVHDGREGAYAGNPRNLNIKRGDRIRIRGVIGHDRHPIKCTYDLSENGLEQPTPKMVEFDWLNFGNEDSQVVEICGQLIGIDEDNNQSTLEMLAPNGGRFRGMLHRTKLNRAILRRMIGKNLRLRGVVGARFDSQNRWSGFQVWLSDTENIIELEFPGEPFDFPITPIARLNTEAIREFKSSFFRTAGVATYSLSPSMVLLQNGSHHLFVELSTPGVEMDRAYEVTGNLDTSVEPAILRMSELTPTTETFSITDSASTQSLEDLAAGDFSGRLVRTVGNYSGSIEANGQHGFLLRSDRIILPVFLSGRMQERVALGTSVEVKGIWIQQKSLVGFNIGSSVLHARIGDVRFGTQLPWPLLSALGFAVATAGLAFIWVATLRRQVQRKTMQLQVLNLTLTDDLQARRLAEVKLKEAQAQAEAANRSKSEFLANMSHEIRTPMTAILGYADILDEEQSKGYRTSMSAECIHTIKRNGEHLLSIINDILDISKIEADKMTAEKIAASPVQIVGEVVELMQIKATAKGLILNASFADGIPKTILTDPTRLRQILVNLVGNAIKFTELGRVSIAVRIQDQAAESINFDVIDTGIGLSEEQIPRLFRSFEQADSSMTRKYGGTGLGLRISKRLAEILGGDISVTSELGKGSVFSLCIATGVNSCGNLENLIEEVQSNALIRTRLDPAEATLAMQSSMQLAGKRILLVEDGPDNQRLIAFTLRKAGADVELVENGKWAVERLTVDGTLQGELIAPPEFDLILMDMQMPELDGYEATKMLRSKGCSLPILAFTAHAMEADMAKCLKVGCNDRLTKPIDKAALIDTCVQWCIGAAESASKALSQPEV